MQDRSRDNGIGRRIGPVGSRGHHLAVTLLRGMGNLLDAGGEGDGALAGIAQRQEGHRVA